MLELMLHLLHWCQERHCHGHSQPRLRLGRPDRPAHQPNRRWLSSFTFASIQSEMTLSALRLRLARHPVGMFRLTRNAEDARLDCTLTTTAAAAEIHSPFAFVNGPKITDNVIHFRGDGQADLSKLYLHLLNAALDEGKDGLSCRRGIREASIRTTGTCNTAPLLKVPKAAYSRR
jgi:hypothetical protein